MPGELLPIHARTRHQAMEWGLALASQGIHAVLDRTVEEGWALRVEPRDFDRAQAVLRQYRLENRGWQWSHPLPQTGMLFHWGSAGWVAAIAAFYYWTMVQMPAARDAGIMDSEKVHSGQWWRLWTAITLHENMDHLMANATIGFILLGLAMARYGAGVGLLAAFIAGAAGNAAGLLFYPGPHLSLGASGMVMGALGLVTVQSFAFWRQYRFLGKFLIYRGFAAGVMVLGLIGFSPGSDVIAHVGGFVAGAVLGCVLGSAPPERLQRAPINGAALLALVALLATAWRHALRAP